MELKCFTVFDSAVGAYLQPFFCPSKGVAIRMFAECVNDSKHQFGKYPSDYVLFELGSWDDANAKFAPLPAPMSIGVGIEFLNKASGAGVSPEVAS